MSLHIELSLLQLSFLHLPWAISVAHQDSANCSGDSLQGNLPGPLPLTHSGKGTLHGRHHPSAHDPLLVQLLTCPCPLLVYKVSEDGGTVLFALYLLGSAHGEPSSLLSFLIQLKTTLFKVQFPCHPSTKTSLISLRCNRHFSHELPGSCLNG